MFHHPNCVLFEVDDEGKSFFNAKCTCADQAPDDIEPELGDTIATIAPRLHLPHVEIDAEILKCLKNGKLRVRALSGEHVQGKTLIVPRDRCIVVRKAA